MANLRVRAGETDSMDGLLVCGLGYTRLVVRVLESLGLASAEPSAVADELARVLDRVRPQLISLLSRYRIRPDDARILQEVYAGYLERRGTIVNPEAWLVRALRNKAVDHVRREQGKLYDAVDSALLEVLAGPAPNEVERRTLLSEVRQVISRLKENCRRVLGLRYRLGLDPVEAAEEMGYGLRGLRNPGTPLHRGAGRQALARLAQAAGSQARNGGRGRVKPAPRELEPQGRERFRRGALPREQRSRLVTALAADAARVSEAPNTCLRRLETPPSCLERSTLPSRRCSAQSTPRPGEIESAWIG